MTSASIRRFEIQTRLEVLEGLEQIAQVRLEQAREELWFEQIAQVRLEQAREELAKVNEEQRGLEAKLAELMTK